MVGPHSLLHCFSPLYMCWRVFDFSTMVKLKAVRNCQKLCDFLIIFTWRHERTCFLWTIVKNWNYITYTTFHQFWTTVTDLALQHCVRPCLNKFWRSSARNLTILVVVLQVKKGHLVFEFCNLQKKGRKIFHFCFNCIGWVRKNTLNIPYVIKDFHTYWFNVHKFYHLVCWRHFAESLAHFLKYWFD